MYSKISDDITICLTADICNAVFPEHRDIRRWDNIICAGLRLEEITRHIMDDFGRSPKITWFVRADPWMRRRFKLATFLFERHRAHFMVLGSKGHEIAWHPHLDIKNLNREMIELPEIVEQVRDIFHVSSVRSGEGFHSSELMKLFEELNFTADSTALPGRYNLDCRTPFDWRISEELPYLPDRIDYRVSDKTRSSRILEIPFTMLPIRLPHDRPGPASRYMNLSYHPELFQMGLLSKRNWSPILVGITHPAEICPPRGYTKKHSLLSLDESVPARNLTCLIDHLRSMGKKVRYRTINEAEMAIRESLSINNAILSHQYDRIKEAIN